MYSGFIDENIKKMIESYKKTYGEYKIDKKERRFFDVIENKISFFDKINTNKQHVLFGNSFEYLREYSNNTTIFIPSFEERIKLMVENLFIQNIAIDQIAIAVENGENKNAFDNNTYFSNTRPNIIPGRGITEKDIENDFYDYTRHTYDPIKKDDINYVRREEFNSVLAPIELAKYFKNILYHNEGSKNYIFDSNYNIFFSSAFKDKKSWYIFDSSKFGCPNNTAMYWSVSPKIDDNFSEGKMVDIKLTIDNRKFDFNDKIIIKTTLDGVALYGDPNAAIKIKNN